MGTLKIFFKALFDGFVNDEVLTESGIVRKLTGTKFSDLCLAVRKSATGEALGRIFDFVYLTGVFIYISPFTTIQLKESFLEFTLV